MTRCPVTGQRHRKKRNRNLELNKAENPEPQPENKRGKPENRNSVTNAAALLYWRFFYMNKRIRKLLAALLTVAVMLSLIPMMVLAEDYIGIETASTEIGTRVQRDVGFHCHGDGSIGPGGQKQDVEGYVDGTDVWLEYTGMVANQHIWKLVALENGIWVPATQYVCPRCGATDWASFSNNTNVPQGKNVQLNHYIPKEVIPETGSLEVVVDVTEQNYEQDWRNWTETDWRRWTSQNWRNWSEQDWREWSEQDWRNWNEQDWRNWSEQDWRKIKAQDWRQVFEQDWRNIVAPEYSRDGIQQGPFTGIYGPKAKADGFEHGFTGNGGNAHTYIGITPSTIMGEANKKWVYLGTSNPNNHRIEDNEYGYYVHIEGNNLVISFDNRFINANMIARVYANAPGAHDVSKIEHFVTGDKYIIPLPAASAAFPAVQTAVGGNGNNRTVDITVSGNKITVPMVNNSTNVYDVGCYKVEVKVQGNSVQSAVVKSGPSSGGGELPAKIYLHPFVASIRYWGDYTFRGWKVTGNEDVGEPRNVGKSITIGNNTVVGELAGAPRVVGEENVGKLRKGVEDVGELRSGTEDVGELRSGTEDVGELRSGTENVGPKRSGTEIVDKRSGTEDVGAPKPTGTINYEGNMTLTIKGPGLDINQSVSSGTLNFSDVIVGSYILTLSGDGFAVEKTVTVTKGLQAKAELKKVLDGVTTAVQIADRNDKNQLPVRNGGKQLSDRNDKIELDARNDKIELDARNDRIELPARNDKFELEARIIKGDQLADRIIRVKLADRPSCEDCSATKAGALNAAVAAGAPLKGEGGAVCDCTIIRN